MQSSRLRPRLRPATAALPMIGVLASLLIGYVAAQGRGAGPPPRARVAFRNVAESAGLDFVLENNPSPRKHLIETMAGGVAAFDYDGDGLTDIYFTNGASIPALQKDAPRFRNRLFRNLGGMKFKDV